MTTTTFIGHFLGPDTHTNRPAVTGLPNGTIYVCTTHSKLERVVSGAWVDYATLGGGGGGIATDPIFTTKGDTVAASGSATAARLAIGSDGQVLTADSAQTLGVKWAAAGGGSALTLLSTTTLSSAGTFDISSISGSYNDLILVVIHRSADAGSNDRLLLRLNNDSGTNYYEERVVAVGTATTAPAQDTGTTYLEVGRMPAATGQANSFGVTEITVFGYASTTWVKTLQYHSFHAVSTAAGNYIHIRGGGWWNNTAAITRVTVLGQSTANLVTGSQLRIYGRA